jgi:rhombotail lipoprotein
MFHLLLLALLLLAGCASSYGLDRRTLDSLLQQDLEDITGRPVIEPAPAPRLVPPLKLAIYLQPTGYRQRQFEWNAEDRDRLTAWAEAVKARGLLSDIWFLPDSSLPSRSIEALRAAARRYHADLLLVVSGAGAIDRYNNGKAGLWYWTIVGAYTAHGTHSDALAGLKGSLWSVSSGELLGLDEGEGSVKRVGPAARVDDRDTIRQAERLALEQLSSRVAERLRELLKKP